MLKIEQWIIHNNPNFFIKEIKKKGNSSPDLRQVMENVKQAELELLNLLESEQVETEEK